MVKQGILITPVLGEVLTNLAPLRMKHSASVPAYHKGKPTWLFLYLFACALTHLAILTLCKGDFTLVRSNSKYTTGQQGFQQNLTYHQDGCNEVS